MKCRYKYCKHGGEVDKSIAVKEGNAYYHKECLHEKKTKQEIEDYWNNNMPYAVLQILRKVINTLINDKDISADFILFTLKYIKENNKPINNPFGLNSYCTNVDIINRFKKININKKYREIKEDENNNIEIYKKVEFKYNKPKKRNTDII